jgi:hypothetical protein
MVQGSLQYISQRARVRQEHTTDSPDTFLTGADGFVPGSFVPGRNRPTAVLDVLLRLIGNVAGAMLVASMSVATPAFLPVRVECYAGYRGEETPRRFYVAEDEIEISDVIERWLTPTHRYFRARDIHGRLHVLRQDVIALDWELAWSGVPPPDPPAV